MHMASASSPPEAPPARTESPAPTPTNSAPTTAASSGISASCGLVELVGQREAHGRDERVGNEAAAQQPPAPAVAQQVQHKAGDSGGEGEPMVEQQRRAEHAALGDAGDGVDVVETKGQKGAGEKRHAAAPALQAAHGGAALVPEAAQGGGRQAKTSRSVVDLAAQAVVSRTKPSG